MKRMFAIAVFAFFFLCIAPGALMLSLAIFAKAPAGDGPPQVQLARDWTRFPPADRANCLRSTGSTGAYTDLLKCLEIKRGALSTVGQGKLQH
jgi:hypothetical protein